MIKLTANSGSKTITLYDSETNKYFTILGKDLIVVVYNIEDIQWSNIQIRTLSLYNKYIMREVLNVNISTIDPSSTGYTTNMDMDTYAGVLISTYLYA